MATGQHDELLRLPRTLERGDGNVHRQRVVLGQDQEKRLWRDVWRVSPRKIPGSVFHAAKRDFIVPGGARVAPSAGKKLAGVLLARHGRDRGGLCDNRHHARRMTGRLVDSIGAESLQQFPVRTSGRRTRARRSMAPAKRRISRESRSPRRSVHGRRCSSIPRCRCAWDRSGLGSGRT
jgi:hypothetical protein